MRELDEILQEAVDRHASDIHITAGRPVIFRIDGDLRPLDSDKLTPEQIEELVVPLFADND